LPPFSFSLFTRFEEEIWDHPTISLFRDTFDNYNPDVNVAEQLDEDELNAFLDAVMETQIMQESYEFLQANGAVTGSQDEFRAKLYEMWFELYDRDEGIIKI
jgi:poly(U)-specific endoribonuclease